jgi:hypothetical protein
MLPEHKTHRTFQKMDALHLFFLVITCQLSQEFLLLFNYKLLIFTPCNALGHEHYQNWAYLSSTSCRPLSGNAHGLGVLPYT